MREVEEKEKRIKKGFRDRGMKERERKGNKELSKGERDTEKETLWWRKEEEKTKRWRKQNWRDKFKLPASWAVNISHTQYWMVLL